jgi:hypothetical protein
MGLAKHDTSTCCSTEDRAPPVPSSALLLRAGKVHDALPFASEAMARGVRAHEFTKAKTEEGTELAATPDKAGLTPTPTRVPTTQRPSVPRAPSTVWYM